MIIDCHCHAGLGDGFTGPWDTEARLGRYLRGRPSPGSIGLCFSPRFTPITPWPTVKSHRSSPARP